jgi:hypothetical protein
MSQITPRAKFSVLSLSISGITSLIGAAVIISGRGAGMEALASLLPLIVFGGGGLVVAFFLGVAAIFRGEQPYILTILAIAIPPVAGLVAPAFGR